MPSVAPSLAESAAIDTPPVLNRRSTPAFAPQLRWMCLCAIALVAAFLRLHDVADSLGMLMESFDAEVRIAYDGISGVDIAAEFQPAIAMIDIRMPMTDGYETARLMRERLGDSAPMGFVRFLSGIPTA